MENPTRTIDAVANKYTNIALHHETNLVEVATSRNVTIYSIIIRKVEEAQASWRTIKDNRSRRNMAGRLGGWAALLRSGE